MRGWHFESMRHSLASRGIRTRAISLPTDFPVIDKTIQKLVNDDRWDLSMEKGKDRHTIAINPRLIPGVKWEKGGHPEFPNEMAIDLNIAHMEEMDDGYMIARLNPESGYVPTIPAVEDGNFYRGISWEEFQFIRSKGFIRSDCSYNIGRTEEGCTYFSEDPKDAAIYGGSFQPYILLPTFERPGYVVKIKRPSNSRIKKEVTRGTGDIAVVGDIPASDILEVYEIRPYSIRPGYVEIYQMHVPRYGGTVYTEGSRSSPSVSVGYKKVDM